MRALTADRDLAVPATLSSRRPSALSIDAGALWIWVLTGGLVLYLGLNGGGYDLVVRSDAAIIVWWVVLLGALAGVLPGVRLTRIGWVALAALAGFVVWNALALGWTISSENTAAELSRVAGYLGVLVLALASYGSRARALRHVVGAVAAASVVLIALAVLSRLRPHLFPSAHTTADFLPGAANRLGWPLNYWNALGALVALTLPLLLAVAATGRRLAVQGLAAAAIPLCALCGYLTFSRGGAIAVAVAVIAYLLLAPERLQKLPTVAVGGAASAALIAGVVHRHALERGLMTPAADRQGLHLLLALVLVCIGAGVAQMAIGLAARHATLPPLLRVPPRRAAAMSAAVAVVLIAVFVAAHGPRRLDHAWTRFKQPSAASLHSTSLSRFGTLSGNGRYTYWKVAVKALRGHVADGYGPGTFQQIWLPRAPFPSYVRNAHSLYVETLVETGVVGLVLLGGFMLLILAGAARAVRGSPPERRTHAAAVTAALAAFAVSCAFDWMWQVPVLPVAALLLAAAALVPLRRRPAGAARRMAVRVALSAGAVAALIAIGIPLAQTTALRRSQADAAAGNTTAALSAAHDALRVEPRAASAQMQVALLLELQGRIPAAVVAARQAAADEPQNWEPWFVLARLEAEAGHARPALVAFRRARALNPQSALFRR